MTGRGTLHVCLVRGPIVAPRGSLNNDPTPPLGLAYVAGTLTHAGFCVQGVDAIGRGLQRIEPLAGGRLQTHGVPISEIANLIDPDTQLIGVSVGFSHEWPTHRRMIESIRARFPNATIVAGGEHVTALPEHALRDCPALDIVVLGEGEETMLDLCNALAAERTVNTIEGVAYRREGIVVTTPRRARMKALDEMPLPDWSVFPIEPYLDAHISHGASFGRDMPMLATRGCPYQCTFCSSPTMWTQRYVLRSPANVVDEIELYQRRYGITGVNFYDLTAIIKKEWIIEFCRLLVDRKVNIDWSLPTGTRSEALDEEVVSWLVRTQCRYLAYAPESGSERVQRQVKKRVRMSRLVASMRAATRAGITVRTNMIVGLPDERRMDIWKTLLAIAQFAWIGAEECSVTIYQPYPGNEIFRDLVKRGAITINDAYFENLAMLSTGRLAPARATFSQHLSRFEVTLYRVLGLVLSYALSYMFYPRRVVRTIRNVFRTSNAATVMEQRLKERVRRLRRVGTREAIVAPVRRSVSEKRGVGSP